MIILDYEPAVDDDKSALQWQLGGHPLVCRMLDTKLPRPNCPNVLIDYYAGTCSLLRHVVQRGWRNLRFLVEDDPRRPRRDGRALPAYHERAIRDTLRAMRLPLSFEQNLIRSEERGAKARYDVMMQHLSRQPLEPGVCLVQDGADGISGTYAALTKKGYVIGRDVAVAALHAMPAWEHVEPVVTFTWERYEEISRLLVDMAVDAIQERKKYGRGTQVNYVPALRESGAVPDLTAQITV